MSGTILPNTTRASATVPYFQPYGGGGGGGNNPNPQFSTLTVQGQTTLQGDLVGINANFGSGPVTVSTITCPQFTAVSSINGAVYPPPAGTVPDPLGLNTLNVSTINQPATGVLNTNTINVSTINCNQAGNGAVNTVTLTASGAVGGASVTASGAVKGLTTEGTNYLSTSGAVFCSTINNSFNIQDSEWPAKKVTWLSGTGTADIPANNISTFVGPVTINPTHTYRVTFEIGFSNNNTGAGGVTQLWAQVGGNAYYIGTPQNLTMDSANFRNSFASYSVVFPANGQTSFTLQGSNTSLLGTTTLLNNHSGVGTLEDLGNVLY